MVIVRSEKHLQVHVRGQQGLQRRQLLVDLGDGLHDVRARLAAHVEQHRRLAVRPRGELVVLDAVDHLRDVGQMHRRVVLVADDGRAIVLGVGKLVVGADAETLHGAVEAAFGRVHVGLGQRRTHVLHGQAEAGKLRRIDLHAHGRTHVASDADQANAADLRQALRDDAVGVVVDLAQRARVRGQHQGEDRRVGRIDLVVHRRIRQVGRQGAARRVDRRLYVLAGSVDVAALVELDDDRRETGRAVRAHRGDAGDLAELALQRRGHQRGHRRGAGAGILRRHHQARRIDVGQCGDRQRAIADHADQQQRHHQQRGGDRALDEDRGKAHKNVPAVLTLRVTRHACRHRRGVAAGSCPAASAWPAPPRWSPAVLRPARAPAPCCRASGGTGLR